MNDVSEHNILSASQGRAEVLLIGLSVLFAYIATSEFQAISIAVFIICSLGAMWMRSFGHMELSKILVATTFGLETILLLLTILSVIT